MSEFNEILKEEGEEVRGEGGGAGDREVEEGGEKGDRREVWEKKEGSRQRRKRRRKKTSHRAAALAPRVHPDGILTMINGDMLIAHMQGRGRGLKQACFALWFRNLFCRGMGAKQRRVEEAKRLVTPKLQQCTITQYAQRAIKLKKMNLN